MPAKGQRLTGRHAQGVPRPHVWICGPDEERHKMYQPWLLAKAQANFRKEAWNLSFEEYYEMWKPHWDNRGRKPGNVCMTRKDIDYGWEVGNVMIITRSEHFVRQGEMRHKFPNKYKQVGRKPGQKNKK